MGNHPNHWVVLRMELSLPPTLNQSYKIVEIKGYSRLALTEEALDFKKTVSIVAANTLTHSHGHMQTLNGLPFPIINGPGGGEYRLELAQWLPRNSTDTGLAPASSRRPTAFDPPDRFDGRACHSMRRRSSGGGDSFLNSTRAHEASDALSGH